MESKFLRLYVAEIEKKEENFILSEQWKELSSFENDHKKKRKKTQRGKRQKGNAIQITKTTPTTLRQAVIQNWQRKAFHQQSNLRKTTETLKSFLYAKERRLAGHSKAFVHSSLLLRICFLLSIIFHTG